MAEGSYHSKGPLNLLFRAVRDRTRIKVWTRNHSEVRSILTGFLHAYDRHLNLAMADVDEVLLLPASIKTPILHPVVRRGPHTPPGSPDESSDSEEERKNVSHGSKERPLELGQQEKREGAHQQESREGSPDGYQEGLREDEKMRWEGPGRGLEQQRPEEPQEGRQGLFEDPGEAARTDEPMVFSRISSVTTSGSKAATQTTDVEDLATQWLKHKDVTAVEVVDPSTEAVVESSNTGHSEGSKGTHSPASRVPQTEGSQVEPNQQPLSPKSVPSTEEIEKISSSLSSSSLLTALLASSACQMQSPLPKAYQTRRYQGTARMDEIMKFGLKLPSWASEVRASRSGGSGSRSSEESSRISPGTPPSGHTRFKAKPFATKSAADKCTTRSSALSTLVGSPPSPTALVTTGADVVTWKLREIDLNRHEQTSSRTKTKKKPRRRTSVVPVEQVPRATDDPTSPLKDPRVPSCHVDASVPRVEPINELVVKLAPGPVQTRGLVNTNTTDELSQEMPSGSELTSTGDAYLGPQAPVKGVEETRLCLQGVQLGRRNVRSSSSGATSTPLDKNAASTSTGVSEPASISDPRSSSLLRRASVQSLDFGPDTSSETTCTEIGEVAEMSCMLEDPRIPLEVAGDEAAAIGSTEQEPEVPLGSGCGHRLKRTSRDRRRARQVLTPRKRHVNQLFVRGDNIVAVSLLPV